MRFYIGRSGSGAVVEYLGHAHRREGLRRGISALRFIA